MSEKLIFAIPSKGRLMDKTIEMLDSAGLKLRRVGHERGYSGEIDGFDNVDVTYMSASEIAQFLKNGRVHLGITGEDLVQEAMFNLEERVEVLKPLGFGGADVVIAVPECWLDVRRMADLGQGAETFRKGHGRRMRVATKYMNLTRRFFAYHGITSYRIVESLGATEGTVAAGTAEMIVDITSTGTTIKANGLKLLADGTILKSQANLFASRQAEWTPAVREAENELVARLGV